MQRMLIGHIDHIGTYQTLLAHPAWKQALNWIQQNTSKEDGEYEIQGRDIYASVQTVEPMPREQAVFEAHKKYIDLHYCIEGGEIIEWAPVDMVTPKTEFDTEKDYGLYESPASASSLLLTPGTFAIFFPADAHMTKIFDGNHAACKKVVIKTNTALLK